MSQSCRASAGGSMARNEALDPVVDGGEGAALLGRRRGREEDVGKLGALGREDILHKEKVELCQGLSDSVIIGEGEDVAPGQEKGLDAVLFDPLDDLPQILSFLCPPLISCEVAGGNSHVEEPLGVVFLINGEESPRFLAEAAGKKGQVYQGIYS